MEVKVSMANPRVATYNAMMQYNTATNPNNYDRTMFFVSGPYLLLKAATLRASQEPPVVIHVCTDWYYDIPGCLMIPLIAQKESKVRCSYVVRCCSEASLTLNYIVARNWRRL